MKVTGVMRSPQSFHHCTRSVVSRLMYVLYAQSFHHRTSSLVSCPDRLWALLTLETFIAMSDNHVTPPDTESNCTVQAPAETGCRETPHPDLIDPDSEPINFNWEPEPANSQSTSGHSISETAHRGTLPNLTDDGNKNNYSTWVTKLSYLLCTWGLSSGKSEFDFLSNFFCPFLPWSDLIDSKSV